MDTQGRYPLQIFKSERLRFAVDSKTDGSNEELKSAVMGSSTDYGTVTIEGSSLPNCEGTVQRRQYKLEGKELSYQVRPRADGSIPVSVWRRLD